MNFEEAVSAAILGDRVRPDTFTTAAYVDYQFNGLRIVYPSGSHSGFTPTDADKAANWVVVPFASELAELQFAEAPLGEPIGVWGTFESKPKRDKWGRPQ
jgi:hypothetical protein